MRHTNETIEYVEEIKGKRSENTPIRHLYMHCSTLMLDDVEGEDNIQSMESYDGLIHSVREYFN